LLGSWLLGKSVGFPSGSFHFCKLVTCPRNYPYTKTLAVIKKTDIGMVMLSPAVVVSQTVINSFCAKDIVAEKRAISRV